MEKFREIHDNCKYKMLDEPGICDVCVSQDNSYRTDVYDTTFRSNKFDYDAYDCTDEPPADDHMVCVIFLMLSLILRRMSGS